MKYLKPIYQALLDSNQRSVAEQWYHENIDFYHPYVVEQLQRLLDAHDKKEKEGLSQQNPTWKQKILQTTQKVGQYVFNIGLVTDYTQTL